MPLIREPTTFFADSKPTGGGPDWVGCDGPDEECPELTTSFLVDVSQAGNCDVAAKLAQGATLTLEKDDNGFVVKSESSVLGWLPTDKATLLNRCISQGYRYSAAFGYVRGEAPSCTIQIRIERI